MRSDFVFWVRLLFLSVSVRRFYIRCMKYYSLYNAVKLVVVASVLLATAVARRRAIDSHYDTVDICNTCFDSSRADPTHLYEFGRCAFGWRNGQKSDNLLRPGGFWEIGVGSSVYSYVPTAAIIFVALVLMSILLPCVSWKVCGFNFDHDPLHPPDVNDRAAAGGGGGGGGGDEREDAPLAPRTPRDGGGGGGGGGGVDSKQPAARSGGDDGANNSHLGDAQLAHDIERAGGNPVAAGVAGAPPIRSVRRAGGARFHTPSDRLNYGFGFVSHNDQCVFLHYQVGLLCGLLILVLSQMLGELYLRGTGSAIRCYVSAYTIPMDLAFDILVILAFIALLVECCINFCFPRHRFVFNVITGLAMAAIVILSAIMAFRNVLGPAGDAVTFVTTLIGILHVFEVPFVLLRWVSDRPPTDYMHV